MIHGIDTKTLFPSHVAFIMDGNRRWAKKNNLPIIDGHKKGAEIIKKIVSKSIKLNIKYLTFYGFSTENWNRSKVEVIQLQSFLKPFLHHSTILPLIFVISGWYHLEIFELTTKKYVSRLFFFVKMKMIDLEEISTLVVVSSPSDVGKCFKIVKQ